MLILLSSPPSRPPPSLSSSSLVAQQVSSQARCSLHINLANVHILQNDLVQAEKCVQQALAICPTSSDAVRMMVYILLRNGKTELALKVLKERRQI